MHTAISTKISCDVPKIKKKAFDLNIFNLINHFNISTISKK